MTSPKHGDAGGREPFSLHTSSLAGFARIKVSGVLDETGGEPLDQAVLDALSRGAGNLTIDLTDLTGIDACGIECLLALRIACALRRVTVQFTHPARDLTGALADPAVHPPLPFIE